MLWEHYYLLCNKDTIKALLLDRLIYYSQQKEALLDLLAEEQAEGELPQFAKPVKLDNLRGWVRKSAEWLAESLMVGCDGRTVQRRLDDLETDRFLFKRAEKGKTAQYRPNLRYIEHKLADLGFHLSGDKISALDLTAVPMDQDTKTFWDEIPGVDQKQVEAKGGAKLDAEAPWRVWANGNRFLIHAPEDICRISYIIFETTGFAPVDKTWIAAVTQLWEAAGRNEAALRVALKKGQESRLSAGLTFSGPRAFVSYAKDAAALTNVRISVNGTSKGQGEVIRVGRGAPS